MIEAPNRDDEEYGETRLIELLKEHRDRPVQEIVDTILTALSEWSGGRQAHDDVTLVLARVRE